MKNQQETSAGVEEAKTPTPLFSVEVEESVFQKLSNLANKEKIPINELGSALLKCLLMLHRSEVQRVVEQIKRNRKCHPTP